MLKDDFFSIVEHTKTGDFAANFVVCFNLKHIIYQAHFPNNPITPGACIIQISKELFAFLQQTDCTIKKIKSVKFTHPIIPTIHNTVNFKMEWEENNGLFCVKITVSAEDTVFSKIKMDISEKICDF